MKVDLFELLDGFFRGVVYFAYSLLASAFVLLRHPVRGPAYLYRARQSPARRQISAITLLFMAYLGAHAWDIRYYWLGASGVGNSLDPNDWWPILVGGLVSTVIVDSMLRLAVGRRHRTRRRREFVLGTTEYAMFLPALLLTLGLLKLEQNTLYTVLGQSGTNELGPSLLGDWWKLLAAFGIACILVTPAVLRFWPNGRDRVIGTSKASAVRVTSRWLAIATLALLASATGCAIRIHEFLALVLARPEVQVRDFVCIVDPQQPSAQAVLTNVSRSPLLMERRDLVLSVAPIGADDVGAEELFRLLTPERQDSLSFQLQSEGEDSPDLMLPGQTRAVRVRLIPARPDDARPDRARLVALQPWLLGRRPWRQSYAFMCFLHSTRYNLTGDPTALPQAFGPGPRM